MTDYEIRELSFRGRPYKIFCLNRMEQDPSWFSFDDEAGVRDRDWDIKPGDVVFDIGSAYGSYALTALASGAAHVSCWNPNREESEVLAASMRANQFAGGLSIHHEGLWSQTGWLRDTDQNYVTSKFDATKDHFYVWPLDVCSGSHDRLDWMKLDVEGAEEHVLLGARDTIRRFKPRVLVEQHLFKDATIATRVTKLMGDYGYRLVRDSPYHAISHSLYEPEAP